MTQTSTNSRFGLVQIGVILLTLATAGVHLYLFLIEGFLGNGEMAPVYQLLFINNILIYATLAVALVLPVSPLPQVRPVIRLGLIALAVASIASYYHVGVFDLLGWVDKAIEVLLIVAVTVYAALPGTGKEFGEQYTRGVPGAAVQLVAGVAVGIVLFLFLRPLLV